MIGLIGRRLISLVPVLLAVTALTFVIANLLPGDLAIAMLGDQATPENVALCTRSLVSIYRSGNNTFVGSVGC
jgi:peptide/nickel transport system permease protein